MRARTPLMGALDFPFEGLREFDRLLDEMWRMPMLARPERGEGYLTPRMDFAEDDKEVRLYVELPGLDENDVEVLVGEDAVTIKGEKKVEKEEEGKGYAFRERAFGAFYRRIPLDVDVAIDKVEAKFENGLLTVTLPKTVVAQAKYKKIPVHAVHGVKRIEKVEKKAA
jgi:HSP20 family protein